MEDPANRARPPGRLVRACQCNRLERQLMNDAYECLVPILRCRCRQGGGASQWTAQQREVICSRSAGGDA
jgi:hypothetical protein